MVLWVGLDFGEKYLKDYKERIIKNLEKIPEDDLVEPSIKIIGPAIESSKYYIEDDYCREMFAKLIASSCNTKLNNYTHPCFIEIIKELSTSDAKFLLIFLDNNTYPMVELEEYHNNGIVTPFLLSIIDFKNNDNSFEIEEKLKNSKILDNLLRLRLIRKNSSVLELNYDYNNFKNHPFYKACESTIESDSKIIIKKYRLELTELGKDFVACCIPKNDF